MIKSNKNIFKGNIRMSAVIYAVWLIYYYYELFYRCIFLIKSFLYARFIHIIIKVLFVAFM